MKIFLSFVVLATMVVTTNSALADVVDFEDIATPTQANLQSSPFTSGNFTFTAAANQMFVMRNDQPNAPNTGSNTFQANGGPSSSWIMTATNGDAFDLFSVLASEGRNTNTGFFQFSATSIDVLGTFATGGTISTNLSLDLFAEENDLLDFESFSFTGFTDLASVQFTGVGGDNDGYSFGVDDIRTSAVPEPGCLGLLATSLMALGFRRRK